MKEKHFKPKDPGSAITHFIGMIMAILAAVPLLIKTVQTPGIVHVVSLSIFAISMIALYAASTLYHTLDLSKRTNIFLKKMDHIMIFFLIAGSYTPICLVVLNGKIGVTMMIIIWSIALIGTIFKLFWVTCPRWVSSVIYIVMGWTCLLAFAPLINALPTAAFAWLLGGGIIYTVGGIIYALKLPIFNLRHKNFGSHEIFHLFVMGGSICHFIMMYFYIAVLPL